MKILLGSTRLSNEKEMKLTDSKGYVSFNKAGIDESFYGGRVENVAVTDKDGVYLLVEGDTVFDILVTDLQGLLKAELVYFAKRKLGLDLSENDTKKELVKQIKKAL